MTLVIIYLALAGLGTFLGEISNDLLVLGIPQPWINIVGKALAASAGVLAAVRALLDTRKVV